MTNRTIKPLKSRILKIASVILMLIAVPVIVNMSFGDFEQFTSFKTFLFKISYGSSLGALFWLGNWAIGVLTGRKLDWRKNPGRANTISLLAFIGFGILVSIFVPYYFIKYVWQLPAEKILSITVGHSFITISIDIIFLSIFYSRFIVRYWGESMKNEEELKRENLIARYEALKNQVNPHFLFNTLNTLSGVVEKNPEKASEFIRKLSDIYRYVLEQKDKELIDLDEELRFVNDYIYLSKIRHGEGLTVVNKIKTDKIKIAPLGLQMLIENAIKHNVVSDDEPLNIEIGTDENYIYVRNTLQKKSTLKSSNPIGLDNLIKRYEYLSDKKVIVSASNKLFEVRLPILKKTEL